MSAWTHWLGLGATVMLAGCAGGPEPTPNTTPLSLSAPTEVLAAVALREPMVVEHPAGALFVAGYTQAIEESLNPPKLYKSADAGVTWQPVFVGTAAGGAIGNSDVDLAVAPDGTLYFLTMGFDRATREGTHVSVGVSHDIGESWTWTAISRNRFDDRPWIKIAPDGTALVIWNDGQGVRFATSSDRGATWAERARIHSQGHSSHLAVGSGGQIAIRITPVSASGNQYDEGVDLLAVSTDGGATWEKHTPPGHRTWIATGIAPGDVARWVEPVAWDGGALYSLWSERGALWLGRSSDQGQTWEQWTIVSADQPMYYPYLVANGHGQLAASWYSGTGDDLRAHVALIDGIGTTEPTVRTTPPFQVDSWRLTSETPMRDTAGEYFPVVFLADGALGVATAIQNPEEGRFGFSWYRVSY